MADGLQLWMTPRSEDPVRFFLAPRGLRLPSGPMLVRSMQLGMQEVDPEAIEPFEVTAVQAQAHIDAGWSSFIGSVRDTYHSVLGQPASGGAPELAAWLGATPGELFVDPEKRRESGRSLLSKVGSLLGRPMGDDELDRVEDQIHSVRDTLVEQGGKLVQTLERAADAAVDALQGSRTPSVDPDPTDEERS